MTDHVEHGFVAAEALAGGLVVEAPLAQHAADGGERSPLLQCLERHRVIDAPAQSETGAECL
ncbi:hypothetical protein [Enterobacter asburiae]|uniref:hypothetical protein n=1 Tax=Enterobacter asburiae TaxID=61645 RepID=UPI0018ED0B47|nr:hypothetical protein [Enterobacter asburiae]MBJ6587720.1 hypothetical protein [Enterobacter asburiae]